MIAGATKPQTKPPKLIPQKVKMMSRARSRLGANSELKATMFGMMPPSPTPVRNRIAARPSALVTNTVA
jgi:hypothetical protein